MSTSIPKSSKTNSTTSQVLLSSSLTTEPSSSCHTISSHQSQTLSPSNKRKNLDVPQTADSPKTPRRNASNIWQHCSKTQTHIVCKFENCTYKWALSNSHSSIAAHLNNAHKIVCKEPDQSKENSSESVSEIDRAVHEFKHRGILFGFLTFLK